MWAQTSESAKEGVFIRYQKPNTELEQYLDSKGISLKVIERKDSLDEALTVGGLFCNHVSNKRWYELLSDGEKNDISEPRIVKSSKNKEHIGCMISTYETRVTNGSYIIYATCYSERDSLDSPILVHINKIILTPEADEKFIIQQIKDLEF